MPDGFGLASDTLLVPAIVAGFAVSFSALWIAITSLLGQISGWNGLARAFPDHPEPAIASFNWQSARMRGVNFSNCLRFEACATGLRVSIPRIFGPLQQPFLVPWRQIRTEPRNALFVELVRLRLGPREEGSLLISRRLFERIAAVSPLRAP